jgi:hypothetical protein
MLFGSFDKVKMFRFKIGKDRVMVTYPILPTYVKGYNIYVLVTDNYSILRSDGRIASTLYYSPTKLSIGDVRNEIYKQPVYSVEVNNVSTFHALQKEFTLFKRYTTFKRYKNSIKFLELPTDIINKIAWYCV